MSSWAKEKMSQHGFSRVGNNSSTRSAGATSSLLSLTRSGAVAELQKISDRRERKLEAREKEMLIAQDKILSLRDDIQKISGKLRQRRAAEKDLRVSTGRLISHGKTLEIDREKRPSDRSYEIRNYSKMDMDVWRYQQLRDWFNTYAKEEEKYRYIPSETGYTIRIK